MKTFERNEFVKLYDDGGATFSDLQFVKCSFRSCGLSLTRDPNLRSLVRNVRLTNCEQRGSIINCAVFEDVVVDGLKTNGTLQAWAAVFKHVVFKGRVGIVMISPAVASGLGTQDEQRTFDSANAKYYSTVDWALDISEAEFEDCELQGVPAHLVRRDPATQVVVKREMAMQGKWRDLDLSKTHWKTSIEFFLSRGDADVVLVAGKRDRKFHDLLDGLKKLREAGVAEPD